MWTAVERDDAGVVHHLVRDGDVTGSLENTDVVVVAGREHHRGQTHGDAAIPEVSIFPRIGRTSSGASRKVARSAGTRLVGQRRQPSVLRIDDERAAAGYGRQVLVPMRRPSADRPAVRDGRNQLRAPRERGFQVLPVEKLFVSDLRRTFEWNREVVVA